MKKRKKGKKGKKKKKTKKIKKVKKARKLKKRRAKRVRKVTRAKKTKKAKKPKRRARAKKIKRPKRAKKIKKRKKAVRVKKVEKPKEAMKIPKIEKVEITEKPAEAKVPYTLENAQLCICKNCPIQAESMCVKEKMEKMQVTMQEGALMSTVPPPADLPGMYCATGVAACKDLDFTEMCMCGGCQVWARYYLAGGKPMGYFCRDGKAE
jgi:hypothetical protein